MFTQNYLYCDPMAHILPANVSLIALQNTSHRDLTQLFFDQCRSPQSLTNLQIADSRDPQLHAWIISYVIKNTCYTTYFPGTRLTHKITTLNGLCRRRCLWGLEAILKCRRNFISCNTSFLLIRVIIQIYNIFMIHFGDIALSSRVWVFEDL